MWPQITISSVAISSLISPMPGPQPQVWTPLAAPRPPPRPPNRPASRGRRMDWFAWTKMTEKEKKNYIPSLFTILPRSMHSPTDAAALSHSRSSPMRQCGGSGWSDILYRCRRAHRAEKFNLASALRLAGAGFGRVGWCLSAQAWRGGSAAWGWESKAVVIWGGGEWTRTRRTKTVIRTACWHLKKFEVLFAKCHRDRYGRLRFTHICLAITLPSVWGALTRSISSNQETQWGVGHIDNN